MMIIVVNFKRFVSGEGAVRLARICRDVRDEVGVRIVCAVTKEDFEKCSDTGAECWSQKYEPDLEAKGTLLNHSDFRLEWTDIKLQIANCQLLKMEVCVCCNTLKEGIRVADLKPEWVAYEPEELIGHRDRSVSSERPETVRQLVKDIKVDVLVGAGIHAQTDVEIALGLGAKGILVATDVVKAVDPEKELRELTKAFKYTTSPA